MVPRNSSSGVYALANKYRNDGKKRPILPHTISLVNNLICAKRFHRPYSAGTIEGPPLPYIEIPGFRYIINRTCFPPPFLHISHRKFRFIKKIDIFNISYRTCFFPSIPWHLSPCFARRHCTKPAMHQMSKYRDHKKRFECFRFFLGVVSTSVKKKKKMKSDLATVTPKREWARNKRQAVRTTSSGTIRHMPGARRTGSGSSLGRRPFVPECNHRLHPA